MSGEDLRRCCIYNQVENLKEFLILRANPCSTDEYGLGPLHYAIWNGNVECVKYLVMNPNGITKDRERTTCLNLRSSMGYTPLHLVALECPQSSIKDCLFSLLVSGADPKVTDDEGKNPIQLAKEKKNQTFLDSFQEFISMQKESKDQLKQYQQNLKKKYRVIPRLPGSPSPTERSQRPTLISEGESGHNEDDNDKRQLQDHSVNFYFTETSTKTGKNKSPLKTLPTPIQTMISTKDQQTKIIKPQELLVHEELLPQLTRTSFIQLQGVESMKSLSFVKEEALKNIKRREKLVLQSEPTLPEINLRGLSEVLGEKNNKKGKR